MEKKEYNWQNFLKVVVFHRGDQKVEGTYIGTGFQYRYP